ncbi:MAG: ATP-binding protein [Bryobacteraceae bacterium]|jgi:signal transduction histidine kinase
MHIPMPEQERPPAEVLLDQGPACHWIVNSESVFEQVYGDTMPVFGKPTAEVAGQPAASVLKPDVLPTWQERFSRALSGESLSFREERDGRVWFIAVFPLRLKAGTAHAGCVVREITLLARADHELRRTVLGALKAQETQRTRTAQFLHNVVGQNLAALGLRLDLVRMDLNGASNAARERLAEIQTVLESVMEQVRNFSYELNPSAVERVGLRSALDRLGTRVREHFHGSVRVDMDSPVAIQPHAALALYRIAEEAVENAAHHSGCSLIEIAVQPAGRGAWMEVRDNGGGFDPGDLQEMGRGLGLLSMEHHAAEAGLRLSISSSRQSGTVVRAVVPVTEERPPC